MKVARVAGVCVVLALLRAGAGARERRAASCESLASLRLPNATVTSAAECRGRCIHRRRRGAARHGRAAGLLPRRGDDQAHAPIQTSRSKCGCRLSGWNGKFQAVGNGGWAGTIPVCGDGRSASRAATRAAGTDTGHSTPGASFVVGHPEKLVDYAHRSLHEMAVHGESRRQRVLRQQSDAHRCGMAARRAATRG